MAEGAEPSTINEVLDSLCHARNGDRVTVRDIVEKMGERSFAPLLLVPAMILVSPVSSILGMPTFGALVIGLILVQAIMGRKHLWIPEFLARRSLPAKRVESAVNWLRKPATWVDRHVHRRLTYLTVRPLSYIALLTCLALTLTMPLLEVLPMLATVSATAITLFAIGLLTHDGMFIIAGYAFIGLGISLGSLFI
ncbi:exopolysaccharide biosynthesis protein [Actibacterium lipolyticum]|uniref:Exopolysaccharide synthesis, ExoD n=1 Tax=Actibacterium lipolyticum TaxID=1524263 RepID=A0A238KV90_9RHOB|nr:exopolysaccharide biosynthesis protein [Actibacterium lipolyticum]SMX46725.1 Exopolysaccharide synthesis, ExoD [Actibacterium lipolyticum]